MKKVYHNIFEVLIGCINKKGKKYVSKVLLTKSLNGVSNDLNLSIPLILKSLIGRLDSILEIKTRKIRKNIYHIPSPVITRRRNYLIVKKILDTINEDKSKRSFDKKLKEEFITLLTKKHSKSFYKKNNVVKQALMNRSNVHYRW